MQIYFPAGGQLTPKRPERVRDLNTSLPSSRSYGLHTDMEGYVVAWLLSVGYNIIITLTSWSKYLGKVPQYLTGQSLVEIYVNGDGTRDNG